jgi:hypothetical protein
MGQCTGLFVWAIGAGSKVGAVDVAGARVVVVSHGESCDDSDQMLVLVDVHDVASVKADVTQTDAVAKALAKAFLLTNGPWNAVFAAIHSTPVFAFAKIAIGATSLKLGPPHTARAWPTPQKTNLAGGLNIEANYAPSGVKLVDQSGGTGLVARTYGSLAGPAEAEVLKIVVPSGSASGLNILADIKVHPADPTPDYRFDLDVTSVTAMRGKFKYVTP